MRFSPQPGRSLLLAAAAGFVAFALAGCGLGTSPTTVAMRLVNATPSGGQADFDVTGVSVTSGVNFAGLLPYVFISKGENDFSAFVTGKGTVLVPTQQFTIDHPVNTVVSAGVPGSTTAPPKFFLFVDDNSLPVSSKIRLRLINVSPDSGSVSLSLSGAQPVLSGVQYGTASSYVTLPAGTYDLQVNNAAATLGVKRSQALRGGGVFTVFVMGQAANNSVLIVPQLDASI